MNLQNFIWSFEEAHKHFLKSTISHAQYLKETDVIGKRMQKSGFSIKDTTEAQSEGERSAIEYLNEKTSK